MKNKLNFNTLTDGHDEWLTPPEIIKALGPFDLDPCSPIVRPWNTARVHYTKEDDGLSLDWKGRVFLNPPYGNETFKWVIKMADHGNGIVLIFARTETHGFHRDVWQRADAIFFFDGRLSFHHVDGTKGGAANAPSVLVAYGLNNVEAIRNSGLPGILLPISPRAMQEHLRVLAEECVEPLAA